MSYKSDIDDDGRNFVFQPAGDNTLSGTSLENALLDPYEAVTRINALSPPVASDNRASLAGQGIFSSTLSIPRFTAFLGANASILTFDAINIECLGDHSVRAGSLLNFANNGVLIKSDGKTRVDVEATAMVVIGNDGIGFQVSGVSDDSFFGLTQGELRGERASMVVHTATSPSPIIYRFNLVEMFNIDQALIDYDPAPGSSATIIEGVTVVEGFGATTTGCVLFKVRSGILVAKSEVLSCDKISNVFDGATLTLTAQVINGDTLVQAGGMCIYKSSALLQGDLETEATGTLQVDANIIVGTATNAGGMSIKCDSFVGDIVNTGTMFVIIDNYTGTLPVNDGSINGIIGGILYGNWREEVLLLGADLTTQTPTGLDAPMQITFGAAQGSASDPVMLSAAGVMTANIANQYNVSFFMQYGRTGAGQFSKLFFRILVNGSQVGSSIEAKLDNSNSDVPVQLSTFVPMVAGDELTAELVRDSLGGDSGELVSEAPVLAWNAAPSAIIRISR